MNNKNLIIIHGAYGNPNENWFPWLKGELENLNIEVFVPKFPTPLGQSLQSWNTLFKPFEKHLSEKTILVGHSLGPAFILNLLERIEVKISASFFIVPFTGLLGLRQFDSINFSFTDREFNWEKIRKHCLKFYVYHSDNDPYVPESKSKFVAEKINALKCVVIKGGGHLGTSSGFTEFPLLLDDIKKQFELDE